MEMQTPTLRHHARTGSSLPQPPPQALIAAPEVVLVSIVVPLVAMVSAVERLVQGDGMLAGLVRSVSALADLLSLGTLSQMALVTARSILEWASQSGLQLACRTFQTTEEQEAQLGLCNKISDLAKHLELWPDEDLHGPEQELRQIRFFATDGSFTADPTSAQDIIMSEDDSIYSSRQRCYNTWSPYLQQQPGTRNECIHMGTCNAADCPTNGKTPAQYNIYLATPTARVL
jgi:hypothetical protein